MTVRHHLIIIKEIAENYKIKELVLESMKKINPLTVSVSLATIPTAVKLLI